MMKHDAYPMHCAARCTAKSKRSGLPCKSPAVRGWSVCRMHGARGGAAPGRDHPNYRHGARSQDATALRKEITAILKGAKSQERLILDSLKAP
ncbi:MULTISPECIES: hypothetical protein [unclassified Marinovum]